MFTRRSRPSAEHLHGLWGPVLRTGRVGNRERNSFYELDGLEFLRPGFPFPDRLRINHGPESAQVKLLNLDREKPLGTGKIELGRIISATAGLVSGKTLQLPASSCHTASEMAETGSIAAMLRLRGHLCDLPRRN